MDDQVYFGAQVLKVFSFLVDDLGFSASEVLHTPRDLPAWAAAVDYTHPRLQIAFTLTSTGSLRIRIHRMKTKGFGMARGLDVFRIEDLARAYGESDELIVPRRGSELYTPDEIDHSLARCADLLRRHGPALCRGDFSALERYADEHLDEFPLRRMMAEKRSREDARLPEAPGA